MCCSDKKNSFSAIQYVGNSVMLAEVGRENGVLYLNEKNFYKLGYWARKFVLLHELAHYKFNTIVEQQCDTWAINQLTQKRFLGFIKPDPFAFEQLFELIKNEQNGLLSEEQQRRLTHLRKETNQLQAVGLF